MVMTYRHNPFNGTHLTRLHARLMRTMPKFGDRRLSLRFVNYKMLTHAGLLSGAVLPNRRQYSVADVQHAYHTFGSRRRVPEPVRTT